MTGKISLAPISFSNTQVFKSIHLRLEQYLHRSVDRIELPLDPAAVYSADRKQYYSTKLIAQALPHITGIEGKIVLLAEFDLYIPVLTHVFGEAMLNGPLSIVSLCRLHEEFYTGDSNDELLLDRSMKEILHELGHNFGLYHCDDWNCVMHSSAGIEEVDIKGNDFCRTCKTFMQIKQHEQ